MTLAPHIAGAASIRSSDAEFGRAFNERAAAGLLTGQPHPRSNYRVVESGPNRIRVQAADWWTAINVGLNDVELQFPVGPTTRGRSGSPGWTLWHMRELMASRSAARAA